MTRLAALAVLSLTLLAVPASARQADPPADVGSYELGGNLVEVLPDVWVDADQAAAVQAYLQAQWIESYRPVLECIIDHESRHAGIYAARNRTSSASGAFQWLDRSWQNAAFAAGRPDIAYQPAWTVPFYDQDLVTVTWIAERGLGPWRGICRQLLP